MPRKIEELKATGCASIRFPEGNEIPYFMDFSGWKGLPSDRDFYIVGDFNNGNVHLVAAGYGASGDYGNGSVFVSKKYIFADCSEPNHPDSGSSAGRQ